ncbi:hypothetical protein SeMB42_g00521 [Synchytrium endobioticum]|uniref:COX assembly mitochondrial protein n=1 Tax=Synchytrium endobioticum TaxID=286115 RepID=A0A507DJL2_9FUNG|nr:hypothetical protein SeLEV6574_g00053 [Synchytrium endobioticum]TPX53972.1 hypothetical protein SeMB42_g00521 [Synchytrium endobioticum]
MTRPDACEGIGHKFRMCVDQAGLWGRILGQCTDLKTEFESCMARELKRKRSESLEMARERKQRWKEINEAAGLPRPPY